MQYYEGGCISCGGARFTKEELISGKTNVRFLSIEIEKNGKTKKIMVQACKDCYENKDFVASELFENLKVSENSYKANKGIDDNGYREKLFNDYQAKEIKKIS